MFRALSRLGGATARRAASDGTHSITAGAASNALAPVAARLAPSVAARLWSSFSGTGAARVAPSASVAGAARVGSSLALGRRLSTNNAPLPPGLTEYEKGLYEKLIHMEDLYTMKMEMGITQGNQLNQSVTEMSKLLGEHIYTSIAAVRRTAISTVVVLGLFIGTALVVLNGIVRRAESRAVKATAPEKAAAAAAAEKAAAASEKAAAAAEKAASSAEKATAGAEKAAATMADAAGKIAAACAK